MTLFLGLALWLFANDPSGIQNEPPTVGSIEAVYDPVREGEPVPPGFRQLLAIDAIFPVYDPTFRTPQETEWPDDALIVGVELDGEAKAYPVSFLNRREMVNDWIAGSPILVTW